MEIKSQLTNDDRITVQVKYEDTDSFDNLPRESVTQAYGVCFCGNKMVVVFHEKTGNWTLVGGTVEKREDYGECLRREIKEESNMKVISSVPIGYQEVKMGDKTIYQLRYFCVVEPYGNFISDPAGSVTKIKLIDPKDYKQYIDWLKIGDRIIYRAIEMLSEYNKKA